MYTLHKLAEEFIITSDEEIKKGYYKHNTLFVICKGATNDVIKNNYEQLGVFSVDQVSEDCLFSSVRHKLKDCKKVIARQSQIDFSALKEEDSKEIGWFDVEKLAKIHIETDYAEMGLDGTILLNSMDDYQKGFQKAQALLSDRMFTLEDMKKIFLASREFDDNIDLDTPVKFAKPKYSFNSYIQSIQNKSWKVELEMDLKCVYDFTSRCTMGRCICKSEPKFTDGKIKILKIIG